MKRLIVVLVVIAVVGGAVAGAMLWWRRPAAPADELVASGTIEATEAQLGFRAGGRIQSVLPREGDRVAVGSVLSQLDRTELDARREQAVAQVRAAQALLRELRSGARPEEMAQARAVVGSALERRADAQRDLDRSRTLFEGDAVSREALDKATTVLELASSQVTQTEEQLRLLEAGPRRERIEAQQAVVAQAEAAVRVLDAMAADTAIIAPLDGIVTVRHREPGEVVPGGAAVLTLMNPADRWVRIYVPETRLGAVHLGMAAAIASDTYPGKAYPGDMVFIASEAEFTPKSVQTTEERVRLVYAVKVRIADDPLLELKPGMPADVTLKVLAP